MIFLELGTTIASRPPLSLVDNLTQSWRTGAFPAVIILLVTASTHCTFLCGRTMMLIISTNIVLSLSLLCLTMMHYDMGTITMLF